MNRRKLLVGLCALCALVISTAVPTAAGAATRGTTAYTCKKKAAEGGAGFSQEHCKAADVVGSGAKYEHAAIEEGKRTYLSPSNAATTGTTPFKLKTTIGGVALSLTATTVTGEGWAENSKDTTGEHYLHGIGMLTFSGVTATHGCKIHADNAGKKGSEGVIDTSRLAATTTGQGDAVKLAPVSGTVFASFWVEACELEALNGTYEVTGSVNGVPDGATLNFTHTQTTEQETLRVKGATGPKIGIEGTLTLKGGSSELPGLSLATSEAYKGTTAASIGEAGTGTEITSTNEGVVAKLKATIAGVVTELQATGVRAEGFVEDAVEESGEHLARGLGTITYSGVTVAQPAGKGCKVYADLSGEKGTEGMVLTELLEGTTAGQGDFVKFLPAAGETLATFFLEGCSVEGLNGTYSVKGSVKGVPEGSSIAFTHATATEQGTLTLNGTIKAGLESTVTTRIFRGYEGTLTPLSVTTVETP